MSAPDLHNLYDDAHKIFTDMLRIKFGDLAKLLNRRRALNWACDSGDMLVVKYIFNTYPNIVDYDASSLLNSACTQNHLHVVEYILDKYPDIASIHIGEIAFALSKTNVRTRRYLLERYPCIQAYVTKFYSNKLRYVKAHLADFLIEITKHHDTSFHRATTTNGITQYIYIISVQALDVETILQHVDCEDYHLYFAHRYCPKKVS